MSLQVEKLEHNMAKLTVEVPAEELEKLGRGALRQAVHDGDIENGSVMSGQIAGLVNKEQTAKEIIEELYHEYHAIMGDAEKLMR